MPDVEVALARDAVAVRAGGAHARVGRVLAPFTVTFTQRPSARLLERYCTGLLTEHPNKNCDTLAQVIPGVSEQQLQHLVSDMAWDALGLNAQRVQAMRALRPKGMAC